MSYALGSGWSYCAAGERTFLFDLNRDRYLALPATWEPGFARLSAGLPLADEDRVCETKLLAAGAIVRAEGQAIEPCNAPPFAMTGLGTDGIDTKVLGKLGAAWALVRANIMLRHSGLPALITDLQVAKSRAVRIPAQNAPCMMRKIAGAFVGVEPLFTRYDQCLTRSLALARALFSSRIPAELILGVKPLPFEGHCWVQATGIVLNDEPDVVRAYTPIFVL
jgi:hypothetical protein